MAKVEIPVEAGNEGVSNGKIPQVIQETAERWKPEAMYFTTFNGMRTAFFVFDMPDSSGIPVFSEPFFQGFNANVQLVPVMNGEDLQKGLAQMG